MQQHQLVQQQQQMKHLEHLMKHQKFQLLVDQLKKNQRQEIQEQMLMQIRLMPQMLKKMNMHQLELEVKLQEEKQQVEKLKKQLPQKLQLQRKYKHNPKVRLLQLLKRHQQKHNLCSKEKLIEPMARFNLITMTTSATQILVKLKKTCGLAQDITT